MPGQRRRLPEKNRPAGVGFRSACKTHAPADDEGQRDGPAVGGTRRQTLLFMLLVLLLGGAETLVAGSAQDDRTELLLYCSIVLLPPISEMARRFERQEGVRITIDQGGSEDLLLNLESSRRGDLYIPGFDDYCRREAAAGLISDSRVIGYNQLALVVPKGNPQRLSGDVRLLQRRDLAVVIGNEEISSVGKATRQLLESLGIYREVVENAVYLGTDSRHLTSALKRGEADVVLNWRATALFAENRNALELLDLAPQLAKPQPISLCRLTTSRHPELANRFMQLAAGPIGQGILRRHGFYDASRWPTERLP